jgi:hypothetical protein
MRALLLALLLQQQVDSASGAYHPQIKITTCDSGSHTFDIAAGTGTAGMLQLCLQNSDAPVFSQCQVVVGDGSPGSTLPNSGTKTINWADSFCEGSACRVPSNIEIELLGPHQAVWSAGSPWVFPSGQTPAQGYGKDAFCIQEITLDDRPVTMNFHEPGGTGDPAGYSKWLSCSYWYTHSSGYDYHNCVKWGGHKRTGHPVLDVCDNEECPEPGRYYLSAGCAAVKAGCGCDTNANGAVWPVT